MIIAGLLTMGGEKARFFGKFLVCFELPDREHREGDTGSPVFFVFVSRVGREVEIVNKRFDPFSREK